jgi:hypothetical protein
VGALVLASFALLWALAGTASLGPAGRSAAALVAETITGMILWRALHDRPPASAAALYFDGRWFALATALEAVTIPLAVVRLRARRTALHPAGDRADRRGALRDPRASVPVPLQWLARRCDGLHRRRRGDRPATPRRGGDRRPAGPALGCHGRRGCATLLWLTAVRLLGFSG